MVHAATSDRKVQAGASPTISVDHARKSAVSCMLGDWKVLFQSPTYHGRSFHMLFDSADRPLKPSYLSGGSWLQHTGGCHGMAARLTWAVSGHAPIGSYQVHFFMDELISCPHCCTILQTVDHILYECPHYLRALPLVAHLPHRWLLTFLTDNPGVFMFQVH